MSFSSPVLVSPSIGERSRAHSLPLSMIRAPPLSPRITRQSKTARAISPSLAKTSAAPLLSSILGGTTTDLKDSISPITRDAITPTRSRGDASLFRSSSVAELLTGGGVSGEGGERGGIYHQTFKKQVSLPSRIGTSSSSSITLSSSKHIQAAARCERGGDGITLPATTIRNKVERRVVGREVERGKDAKKKGADEEEEKKDGEEKALSYTLAGRQQAEAAVMRALLDKARLASVRLHSESNALETRLESLKARRGALSAAQGFGGGGQRGGGREEEEARIMRGLQTRVVGLMRAKEQAEEERDKLKKDALMHRSMLATSLRGTEGTSSPSSLSVHSSDTPTTSSSSSSSPPGTPAAVDALNQQLQELTQENEALSSQLLAAQLLRRQEQQQKAHVKQQEQQQQQQQQQQQLGSPVQVREIQHRLGQVQDERDALLREQKRLLKDKSRSDAQLLALLAQVRAKEEREVSNHQDGLISTTPKTKTASWSVSPPSLGLPPTPRSMFLSTSSAPLTPPARKATVYSPLSAAASPSSVLTALNRRIQGQQHPFSSSPSSSPASRQGVQQLKLAMLESNQLKAELNENNRLLDLLKRKMMRDEEEAEEDSLVRMGDSSEESESEEDGREGDEEEESVVIQEDRWQILVATRPRMSV